MSDELYAVYQDLRDHDALQGSHVSLDADPHGNEYVFVGPDWIDLGGVRRMVYLVDHYGLSLAATAQGFRIERHSSGMVQAVDLVKRTVRDAEDAQPEGEDPGIEERPE